MQFTKPLYLLLFIPLTYYTFALCKRSLADLSGFTSKLALALRLLILLMLVSALAGARTAGTVSHQCVVFVLDVSDSIPKARQEAALAYVNTALKSMSGDQKVGIVVFGSDASVELAPCTANRVDKIYSVPNRSNTDIAQALGLALASFPEQCAKKIVLFSDGNETIGKAIEQAALIGSNDVSIDVVPLTNDVAHEALLDGMLCPGSAKVGEPFDLKVVTVSKEPAQATIRLLRNGELVGTKTVELPRGRGLFTFQQSVPKPGSYEFRAVLDCDKDTCSSNNVATAYTLVRGKPKVLYVEGRHGQEKYLANALKSSDMDIEVRDPSGIPTTLDQMQNYDMLVLSDVPAWDMSPEQMIMIKSAVKDLGIGFTMIGGENSFGAGGYFDTPIEEALPVDMSLKKTQELPTASVVIVMDKSGSMAMVEDGRQKIELADDAAASVVKLLEPIDYISVIVCHDFPVTAVTLRPAIDKGPIYNEISTIRAEGGGIMVYPSMKMARDVISQATTRHKHVILLADGNDCDEPEGTVALAAQMAREKTTVTTVAFGDGKDVGFLRDVAAAGKGSYYIARRGSDLKAIFAKDVTAVTKSLVIEEPFVPAMDTSCPELSGIEPASTPPLLGYIATSPKAAARVLMLSHKKEPILATWQYGLGKSMAFTSDCKARWAARWISWPGYSKLWAQIVRSTMRKSAAKDYQAAVDVSGGAGHVTIDAIDDKGNFLNQLKFVGSVVGPDMNGHQIAIEQTGPGRYEASFDAREVGSYAVNVARQGQNQSSPEVNVVSIPYPPEYKNIEPETALLKRIASETSGVYSPVASSIFRGSFRKTEAYTDLWRLLTIVALFILPLDVAVRRLTMSSQQALEVYDAVRRRISTRLHSRPAPKPVERAEVTNALLSTKKQRAAANQEPEAIPPQAPPTISGPTAAKPADTPKPEEPKTESTTSRLLEAKKRAKKE